jgi:hypothetical protein
MSGEFKNQKQYQSLEDQIGRDAAAKEVIRQLRMFADTLENSVNQNDYPKVFSAKLAVPVGESLEDTDSFIWGLEVVISHPWPG